MSMKLVRSRGHRVRWVAALTVTASALLAAVSSGPAWADAVNGRNAVPFSLNCDGQELELVSPSEPSAVAQVVDHSGVLIAGDITLTTSYRDPQTSEPVTIVQSFVYGPAHGLATGVQDRLVNCSETVFVDDPDLGPLTITFTGQLVLVPMQ